MDDAAPNLFRALFDWRPREAMRPAENFLTESFVYVLRTVPQARALWLRQVLGEDFEDSSLSWNTRASHEDAERGSTIYPDIEIRGLLATGQPFCCFVENKWGAPFDPHQINKYAKTLRRLHGLERRFLVFVTASYRDYVAATEHAATSEPDIQRAVMMWEHIYPLLSQVLEQSQPLSEFIEFMEAHGLNPARALSTEVIDAYVLGQSLPETLKRWCEKLQKEFVWAALPPVYEPAELSDIDTRFGRTAIVFYCKKGSWDGAVTVGFMHSNKDHRVPFANGQGTGLDLIVRVEANPALSARLANAQLLLDQAAVALRSQQYVARAHGDPANRNRHTRLILQRSLSDVISGLPNEHAQLAAVHRQAEQWLREIFRSPQLGSEIAAAVRGS